MSEYKARHAKKTPGEEIKEEIKEEIVEEVKEEIKEVVEEAAPEQAEPAEEAEPVNEGNERRSEIYAREAAKTPQPVKKKGLSTGVVIVLLVVAIALGGAAGWFFSRGGFNKNTNVPEGEVVDIQNVEVGEVEWVGDGAFNEDLTSEEVDALSDLAGLSESVEWDDLSPLAELDDFDFGEVEGAYLEATGEPVVVAEFDGGQIMSNEAVDAYNEAYTVTMLFGGNGDDVTMQDVLHDLVGEKLQTLRASELRGTLTDEEKAAFKAEAEESYNDYKAMVASELLAEEDMDEAKAEAQADAELKEMGLTVEFLQEDIENTELVDRVMADVVSSVKVGDKEVKAAYDELLAAQKADFEAVPDDFEWASLSGDIIAYNLPGYRAVQVLSINFGDLEEEELAGELIDLIASKDETAADAQESLDALYLDLEETARSCKEQLDSGEGDFESLLVQYGEDEGMADPELRARGYYMGETSLIWSDEVTKAAHALAQPGDVSDIIRTPEGVAILRYVGDVPAGEVPVDQIREGLESEALVAAQEAAREKQVDKWIEDANVKYYLERMQ